MDEPKYLYKYRYFDKDGYHLNVIKDLELYFSSPKDLNDPFDCKISERFDLMSEGEWRDFLYHKVKRENVDLHPNRLQKLITNLEKDIPFIKYDSFYEGMEDHTNSSLGICSFSLNKNQNVLWSLYSDIHKGFLIEFKFEELKKTLQFEMLKSLGSDNQVGILDEIVKYHDNFPVIKPGLSYHDEPEKHYVNLFSIKSSEWIHEDEYRFFSLLKNSCGIPITSDCIHKVIAGLNITEENYNDLNEACREQNIKLVHAEKEQFSFKTKY